MSFSITPELAPSLNYGKHTNKVLDAQIKLAPALYQANEIYQPLYTALNLQNLEGFLLGTPEMSYDTFSYSPARTVGGGGGGGGFLESLAPPGSPESFGFNPFSFGGGGGGMFGGLFGDDDDDERRIPAKWNRTGTATRGAQRGFLSIFEEDIMPSVARAQSTQRAADIADVAKLGPEARAALRIANPDAAALLDEMFEQAQGDLGAGAMLTPAQERMMRQYVRGGQAARGVGFSEGDTFQEALTSLDYGRGLERDRRAYAGNVLDQLEAFYGDPFAAILNRSSQSAAQGLLGQGNASSRMPSLFNPESSLAGEFAMQNQNQIQSRNNAEASNNAAIISGLMSMAGSAAGAAI
jgi:hypothetical protein